MVTEVLAYLGAAGAAGIIGNSAYDAVIRLDEWVSAHLANADADTDGSGLTAQEEQELEKLFLVARSQWPGSSLGASSQNVVVTGSVEAPIINAAHGFVSIGERITERSEDGE